MTKLTKLENRVHPILSLVKIASATDAGMRNVTSTQPSLMSTILRADFWMPKMLAMGFLRSFSFAKEQVSSMSNLSLISFMLSSSLFSKGLRLRAYAFLHNL